MRKFILTMACVAGLTLCNEAVADSISYDLIYGNTSTPGLNGYPAPFATVTVTLTSDGAAIEFVANSTYGYLFGDGNAIDVNVNGTPNVKSGTVDPSIMTIDNSPGSVDGFGKFNLKFTTGNMDNRISSASFDLLGSWSTASEVLENNKEGYLAAAHVWSPKDLAGNNIPVTGFAANGTGHTVPDSGTTVTLLGAAMIGLGVLRRSLASK